MTGAPSSGFAAAAASERDWRLATKACLDQLGNPQGANFGFLYLTDQLSEDASSILTLLRGVTGIRDWIGTVGLGVCSSGTELFDQPAISIMICRLPENSFSLFPPVSGDLAGFRQATGPWLARTEPGLGIVHADPRHPHVPAMIEQVADLAGGFLVGGLSASRHRYGLYGASATGEAVSEGGISGALFARSIPVATGLSQGCSPIGPTRVVTLADDNIVKEIDRRPALEVFKEDIGELLARDLRRVAGYIFAALPIAGSDTGDFLVRNLVAIDPRQGWIAIGEPVDAGRPILFVRRDRAAATTDLERMLRGLKRRVTSPPRGALYISCVARGPNLFGGESAELKMIENEFGALPLTGFFANGEISRDRLYGYTGVLTLFL